MTKNEQKLREALQKIVDLHGSWTNGIWAANVAREALALPPTPAVQVPDAMTDEQIESCALEAGFRVESTGSIWAVDGYVGTRVDPGLRKFVRAILALRHVQVPMTQDEVIAAIKSANISSSTTFWSIFEAGVRAAEAHHGITSDKEPKK